MQRDVIIGQLTQKLRDIERQLQALQRLDVSPPPASIVTYSGTPTSGQLAQFAGGGTLTHSGYAGSAVARYSGAPVAGNYAHWTAAGTVADSGFGTTQLPRYSGTPTAGAIAQWTAAGTVAAASFGTADVATLAGTETFTNKTLTTPTISATGFTNAQHAHTGATSGGQITTAALSDLSTLVQTTGAQTVAGVKTFSDNTLFDASVGIGTAIIAGIQLAIAAGTGRMRIDSTTNGATVAFILGAKGASGAASSSGFYYQGHETAGSRFFAFSADNSNYHLVVTNAGNIGIGNGLTAPLGKLHVDQSSTTAAIPVLILDQADLSEEMIEFDTTVGAGNPVDTAALGTYYGKVRVSVNGTFKYMALYNT